MNEGILYMKFGVCLKSVVLLLWDLVNDARKSEQTDVCRLSENNQRRSAVR